MQSIMTLDSNQSNQDRIEEGIGDEKEAKEKEGKIMNPSQKESTPSTSNCKKGIEEGENSNQNATTNQHENANVNETDNVNRNGNSSENNGSANGNDNNSNNSSGSSSRNSSKPGGYSADCSSLSNCSDSSSETSNSNGNSNDSPSKQNGEGLGNTRTVRQKTKNSNKKAAFQSTSSSFSHLSHKSSKQRSKKNNYQKKQNRNEKKNTLPQWQGIRIVNPMDPRIDLSSVGVIPASLLYPDGAKQLPPSPIDPKFLETNNVQLQLDTTKQSPNEDKKDHLLNQYNDLVNKLEESSCIQALSNDNKAQDATIKPPEALAAASNVEEYSESSMVVLARVKRKHQTDHQVMKESNNTQESKNNLPLHPPDPKCNTGTTSNDSQGDLTSSISSKLSDKKDNHKVHDLIVDKNNRQLTQAQLDKQNQTIVTDSVGVSGSGGTTGTGTGSDEARKESLSNSATGKSTQILDKKSAEAAKAATQERLALKKRKRLDKRREYEEEVQRQLQDSSDGETGKVFKAGEMISMEEALSFADSARLVVQAEPPFLAVHVNAAFSRLTGMHNSGIISRPLSKILSLIDTSEWGSTGKETKPALPSDSSGEQKALSITKIMKNCGFSSCYKVVTNVEKGYDKSGNGSSNGGNSANEGSNNSSITSKEESFTPTKCVMSICTIAAAPTRGRHSSKFRKQEVQLEPQSQKQKRETSDQQAPQRSSHCLIQLTPYDDSCSSFEEKIYEAEAAAHADLEDNNCGGNSSSSHAHACG